MRGVRKRFFMLEIIRSKPFLVAIIAGACAQFFKVLVFLVVEGKINYRRFVQTDGMPNMHATAFTALMTATGLRDGFDSLTFAFAATLTTIIIVDTMNVKNATSRQAEAILLLLDKLRKRTMAEVNPKGLSYSPLDVFTGVGLGVVLGLVLGQ